MQYHIEQIVSEKERYLDLLLLGDEQESMINRYLPDSELYVLFISGTAAGVCAITTESDRLIEIRNLAVRPEFRRQGIGNALLKFAEGRHKGCDIQLGTGETPSTLRFYQNAGFTYSHRIRNFFTDNYDHPIIEEGVLLDDMVYLKKKATGKAS